MARFSRSGFTGSSRVTASADTSARCHGATWYCRSERCTGGRERERQGSPRNGLRPAANHEMPRGVFSKWDLSPDTRKVFEQSTTGKIPDTLIRSTPDGIPIRNSWNKFVE
jgi:hypothetical protein